MDAATQRVFVRWFIRRDMPEVLEIEHDSFECPWSEADFLSCVRQRNCIGMVAEQDNHVVGYVFYELHKSKIVVLNLAVAEKHRRQAIGAALVVKLKAKCSDKRRRILVDVRESNLSALNFFKACGFIATKVLRGLYENTRDDAYRMEWSVRESCVPVNRIQWNHGRTT